MLATLLATLVLAFALMLSLEVLVRIAGRDGARIVRLAMAGLVPAQPAAARRRIRA